MKDNRFVDDLSIEELERVLLIKRREARHARLRRMSHSDQAARRDPLELSPPSAEPPPMPTAHRQFQAAGATATYHSVEQEDQRQNLFVARLTHWLTAPVRINWRFISNRFLLLVEIAAVVGLIVVVLNTWQSQEEISEDVQELLVPPPTPTPTAVPTLNAVVLPSGHTPPDARGLSGPEPIPQHLRALAEAITPHPVPTRGPEHPTWITIPYAGVDHPVVQGDDWEALKQGVGHSPWSANPGEAGNCVLSAHNDIFGGVFARLPDMELGDEIFVRTGNGTFRYVVQATHIVEPTQVQLTEPTDHPVLTLVSSYPYLVDDKRIVVIAELDQGIEE
jgi:sortase A